MKNWQIFFGIGGLLLLLMVVGCSGDKNGSDGVLTSYRVSSEPVVDGDSDDSVWDKATELITYDSKAESNISLKSVHTKDNIYFLVIFDDDTINVKHKELIWDNGSESYKTGPAREDTFCFKWAMDQDIDDLSLSADRPYEADIWFWKADRTNPIGYADDKMHIYAVSEAPESQKIQSKSGKDFYLTRPGDSGKSAYTDILYTGYSGDTVPKTKNRPPEGSRADIQAKGVWNNNRWTIEFKRKLVTGNSDDITFLLSNTYKFGVSKFEMAGREPEIGTDQDLYGTGDITEMLLLRFK